MKGIARRAWKRAPALLLAVALLAWTSWGVRVEAQAKPERHVVEMSGFKFVPAVIHAHAGDTIVWVNRDVAPHTATAKGSWDTGSLAAGARVKTLVSGKGEQAFLCIFHPTMKGVLIVE